MTVSIDSYANPREAEDRRRALKHIAVGGVITGGAAAAEYGLDRRLKAKGAKGPFISAVNRTFKPKTHGPHIAGRLATRSLSATGLPVMAYGLWNIANPKDEVEDLDFNRHVVRPAVDHVTLRDQRNKLKTLRKSLTQGEQDSLVRRKERGTRISHAAGGLGVAALALRAPQAAKFALKRSERAWKLRPVLRAAMSEPKATAASNTLGVASIGTGSIGSFNYAAQQKLEAKQVKKSLPAAFRGKTLTELNSRGPAGEYMAARRAANNYGRVAARSLQDSSVPLGLVQSGIASGSVARVRSRARLTHPKLKRSRVKKSLYDGMVKGIGRVRVVERSKPGYVTVVDSRDTRRFMPESRVTPVRKPRPVEVDKPSVAQGEQLTLFKSDRFLRDYGDRISTKAESGYKYLKDGRDQRRVNAGIGATVSGLSGAMAYSAARGRRFGWAGGHGALAGLSAVSTVRSAREAGRWDARMGKIKAKAMERAAAGEYGRDRVVVKADERKGDDKRGAFAAGAGLGAAAIAGIPLPMRLPVNREASRGIAGRLDGADSGRASVRDVRGVATGEGTRWAASINQDRLAASMADRREAGKPAQDPGRPVRLRRAPDGSMRVIDGHHRIKALMDLGEKDVDVRVEHSGRSHRTWVPLAQRAKYLRDVSRAREFTGQRDLGEIRANAARPIPRAARVGNRLRSRAERGALALRRPAGVAGLAAAAGVATGGVVAHRMANRKKVEKSFTYDSKGRPNGAIPVSQMSVEQRGLLREQAERMARTRKEKGAKFPGLKPLVERGVRAQRPATSRAEQSAKYRATRIERRHGEALAENASRSANALKRRSLVAPSQLGKWGAGLALAGGGAAMLAARGNDKERAGGKAGDAVIAAGAGLGAREAVMGAGGWATKRSIERYRERKLRNPEAKAAYNRDWKAFQEREGFKQFGVKHPGDRIDMTNHDTQVRVGRRYPTSIPGGRAARALAWKNSRQVSWGSKIGVPIAAASLALSSGQPVEKALIPRLPRLGSRIARPSIRSSYVGTSARGRKFTVRGTVR
jgi:hypothetical protein